MKIINFAANWTDNSSSVIVMGSERVLVVVLPWPRSASSYEIIVSVFLTCHESRQTAERFINSNRW